MVAAVGLTTAGDAPGVRALRRWIAVALCAGIFLVQLAWAPLDLAGMGYSDDEVAASFVPLSWLSGDLAGAPRSQLIGRQGLVTAHGIAEPIVKLPFALAGSTLAPLFPASPRFAERFVALLPLLETALLATLLFVWATRLTGDLRWARHPPSERRSARSSGPTPTSGSSRRRAWRCSPPPISPWRPTLPRPGAVVRRSGRSASSSWRP